MAWVSTNDLVQRQIELFQGFASEAYAQALTALREIALKFEASASSEVGVGWGSVPGTGSNGSPQFNRPPVPADPGIEYVAPAIPSAPLTDSEIDDAVDDAKAHFTTLRVPTFSDTPLPILLPNAPTSTFPDPPAEPAPLIVPEYPAEPTYELPAVPGLRTISLPTLDVPDTSTISALLASLRADRPVAPSLATFSDLTDVVNEQYAVNDARLTAFVARCPALASMGVRLAEILSGGFTGYSASVATALRDRAFAVQDRLSVQAETEAMTDWLARGFSLPGGALEAKLSVVRQESRDKKAQINRDIWLEEAKQEIENLRFAIQQGIAYEGVLRQSWASLSGLVLDIAKAEIDTQVRVLEAAIALFDAKVRDRAAEFGTIRDQLQAELAKLDVYRGQLEGQKLIGELNQQDINLYKTRWDAISVEIGTYKVRVEAANSVLQGELAKLDYSTKLVQRYSALVQTHGEEWRAYGIAADAEKSKTELYRAQVDAFSSRVAAYGQQVSAAKTMADTDITGVKTKLEGWQTKVEAYKSELQAEIARVESLVKISGQSIDRYRALSAVESDAMRFELSKLEYDLNVNKLTADVALKEAELAQSRELTLQKVALESLDGIARTGSQLAGSAMSAMNVQASLGFDSNSNFTEYHYYNETG